MTNLTRLRSPLALALCVAAALVLSSCSQTDDAPSTAPSAATPATAPSTSPTAVRSTGPTTAPSASPTESAGTRINVNVTGKQVTPAPATVNISVGESLTITVTSDHDDTLHAHAFDIEKDIKAGQPATITVKGTQPGVYEVELHEPALRLLQVAVR